VKSIKKTFQFGEHEVSLETGAIARQADGAVLVNMAETIVLVTAVGRKKADPGRDFFPLTVNYQEKTQRERNADLPPDRPAHSPAVSQGFQE